LITEDGIIDRQEFVRYWDVFYCNNFGPGEYWFEVYDMNQDGIIDEFNDKMGVIMGFDLNSK
jgi:hypothetical protein